MQFRVSDTATQIPNIEGRKYPAELAGDLYPDGTVFGHECAGIVTAVGPRVQNARIGDPREDLGWMTTMDILSNTDVRAHPVDEGGFLAYYNKLTGLDKADGRMRLDRESAAAAHRDCALGRPGCTTSPTNRQTDSIVAR